MTMLDQEKARHLAELLKVFGQAQRLQILDVLDKGPCAVSEIEARTGIGQPTLSQQLGALRRAGLIAARRESRAIVYSAATEQEGQRIRIVLGLLQPDLLERDMARPVNPSPAPRREIGAQFARVKPHVSR
ncbi:ArsR/SmtB family transcription factor [Acidomonas methanolica]|uniref:Transcriptional regulator ArsR n=1 Tax=Acidomonas methanolica NBRC 104435 TaxID=1231351 RepID=A0A023D1H6_ACIMT|nr:metalloregulator ArsR/SmtB family transcription factor [Acidomonas methanolica]MBU2652893.1 metalloregulator ArsR/SmtB family transcription factor [Acidomonas methanolica]TCS31297.1 DNA-binding transcriptional ArsR family regulator [Acidomonas methanolica]GAJ28008.1 transcriptional regulator ArsR [Acidomonas methanolica NBRC 104435]GBQ54515.1 ArsR family transcriptional regulator [Acidomonas methanolica]GEK98455.1 hypothetical protein AME01nite_09540 [Acidomonas methanolica NBRC 104435]